MVVPKQLVVNRYMLWHSPAMKHKEAVVNIFQWNTPVTRPKNWHWIFRLFRGYLSLKHKYKDWSTLFCLHWEMKGHWSRVNLGVALRKIYTWPVSRFSRVTRDHALSFHFQMQKSVLQTLITGFLKFWFSSFLISFEYILQFRRISFLISYEYILQFRRISFLISD